MFISDVLAKEETFIIEARDTCQIAECAFVCKEYFTHFVCYSTTTQAIVGTSFAVSILVLVMIFCGIVYKIVECVKVAPQFIVQVPNSMPMHAVLLVACLCLISPVSAQCNSVAITESDIVSCITSGNTRSCNIQINVIVSLVSLGSKACGLIMSETGVPIGSFNITYVSSTTIANVVPLYYTAGWFGMVTSSKNCPASGPCDRDDGCPSTFPENFLRGVATMWPGQRACESSCACAGCGCFFCNDACLFWQYGHLPFSTSLLRVYRIINSNVLPSVRFDLEINGITTTQTLTVQPFPTGLLTNYTAMVIGSYSGEVTNFGTDKLVISSTAAKFASANEYNVALYGNIGDIQAASPAAFSTPSTNGFIIPSSLVPHVSSQESVSFAFPASGNALFATRPALPTMIGSTLWSYDGSRLVGMNTNPGGIQVSFSTVSPVKISYDVTAVCPIADPIVSVTGCHNCPLGFSISINSHSSCDSGSVVVSIETNGRITLFTPSVLLGPTSRRYIISLSSLDRSISGTVVLTYGDNKARFPFVGALSDPPVLTQQQISWINSNISDALSDIKIDSIGDWWESLTGTAAVVKWLGAILSIIVSVSIIIGVTVTIGYIIKYLYIRVEMNKSEHYHLKEEISGEDSYSLSSIEEENSTLANMKQRVKDMAEQRMSSFR